MKIKIGIVGTGNVGKEHIRECQNNPEVDLAACACKTEKTAKEIEEKFGIRALIGYQKLLELELDGVIVAVPTELHKEIASECIKKGFNVLVEKPVCGNIKDAEDLMLLAKEKNVLAMPCHDLLYSEGMHFFREYLAKNNFGRLIKVNIKRSGSDFLSEDQNASSMEEVFNTLYHLVYLLDSIVNSDTKSFSTGDINPILNELKVNSKIIFNNGAEAEIMINKSKELKREMIIEADYEKGSIKWVFDYENEKVYSIKDNSSNVVYSSKKTGQRSNLISAFVKAIKEKKYPFDSCKQAIRVIEMCRGVIKNYEQKIKPKRKSAYLQITRKCNNDCVFCSNPKFDSEFSLEYIKKLVGEYKKDGINEIFLTGGEPTIHPNLLKIIGLIKSEGIKVRMITNGIKLADKEFAETIASSGLDSINISFHTHLDELSKEMYGNSSVVEKQKLALKNLHSLGFPFFVNTTINKINCKYMGEYVKYLHSNFPNILHIVFNFLDPGFSDGVNLSNAGKNQWIVPKHSEIELELHKTAALLKEYGMSFRIERVPLCYMGGFEELSTETRKMVKDQIYICAFLRSEEQSLIRKVRPEDLRKKYEACGFCRLNGVCAGLQKEYASLHGTNELYPVFKDKTSIIKRIIENG